MERQENVIGLKSHKTSEHTKSVHKNAPELIFLNSLVRARELPLLSVHNGFIRQNTKAYDKQTLRRETNIDADKKYNIPARYAR